MLIYLWRFLNGFTTFLGFFSSNFFSRSFVIGLSFCVAFIKSYSVIFYLYGLLIVGMGRGVTPARELMVCTLSTHQRVVWVLVCIKGYCYQHIYYPYLKTACLLSTPPMPCVCYTGQYITAGKPQRVAHTKHGL